MNDGYSVIPPSMNTLVPEKRLSRGIPYLISPVAMATCLLVIAFLAAPTCVAPPKLRRSRQRSKV